MNEDFEFTIGARRLLGSSKGVLDFGIARDGLAASGIDSIAFEFRPTAASDSGFAGVGAFSALNSGGGSFAYGQAAVANGLLAGKSSDLDASLRQLSGLGVQADALGAPGVLDDATLREQFPLLTIHNGSVVVDIASSNAPLLLEKLNALGLQHGAAFGNIVSGLLPVAALAALEGMDGVVFARASMMHANVGSVTNQADPALQADVVRNVYDVDGSGQTIGVMSDSFNHLGGYQQDRQTGDLPVVQILEELPGNDGIDEGRAMAQIIHDIAPGADLIFHTAFLGIANFAQGILDLANAGATIITDDIVNFANPMFQDGLTAQAVDQVRGDGILYFSSAGNQGSNSYESAFVNSGFVLNGPSGPTHVLHDFDPSGNSDPTQTFGLAAGGSITLAFQWDQPFQSVSGGQGSQNDMDIFIADAFSGQIIGFSAEDNIGGDAVEVLRFTNNTGQTQIYDLLIGKFAGASPGFMKYVDFGQAVFLEYPVNKSTTYGHANAVGALSVGAASYDKTPEYGQNPALPEEFTSLGGTRILFNKNGVRLAGPEFRQATDFTAVDNGNTTFFQDQNDYEGDGFPNFPGTSAAAPAAAAVAALIAEATGANADAIEQALFTTALNMGAAGFDRLTGWGLIQADDAIAALLPSGDDDDVIRGGSAIQPRPGNNGIDDVNPNAPASNDVISTGKGKDLVGGGGGKDRVNGGSGNDSLYGEAGNDTLTGGVGADRLNGGAAIDWADYSTATRKVVANLQTPSKNTNDADGDTYTGIENLRGGDLGDALSGNAVANALDGGKGNDTLTGGKKADTLTGGAGADDFVLDNIAAGGADVFTDFKGIDTIALEGSVFGLPNGALAPSRFVVGNAAQDANDRLIYNSGNGKLFFDADGTGAQAQVLIATLSGSPALSAADFAVI